MTLANENCDEVIGRLLRELRDSYRQRDEIDAELSQAALYLHTAATQIELLVAGQRCAPGPPLSHVHMEKLLSLLARREKVQLRVSMLNNEVRRLKKGESLAAGAA